MTTEILVLASNPLDTQQLGLRQEFRKIEEARKDSQNKHKFTVDRVVAATLDDLEREILETKARIVHFCGHGLGEKGLVLETQLGKKQPISTQALGGLFKLLANQVECVILNACYSQAQAAKIKQHINYVIGTVTAIRDDAAIAFSKGFYTALFSGQSIESAYELGKNRIQQEIYNPNNQGRKLVPVDREEGVLSEEDVFTFHIRNPLNQIILEEEPINIENIPSNLNQTGSAHFVGREEKLEELHQLLQQNEKVTIFGIAGMGGIGKTELALQYARTYQDEYPGSLCWFSVRGKNLVTQIIEFAGTYLDIFPPKELESDESKVGYCWKNWRSEPSLIVLDDVPDYGQFDRENVAPYLPPTNNKIKVLMTSRERPGANIPRIDLDVLSEVKALELLTALIGKSRIEAEPEIAKELCKWLGYLPLGLELVGRYLDIDPSLTLETTLQNLENQKLKAEELLNSEQYDMTAQLGVAAAFELSWQKLNPEAQRLGCYLSLFDSESFEWSWVENALIANSSEESSAEPSKRDLLKQKRDLLKRNLVRMIPQSQSTTKYQYQLHSLIAQYFRAKLEEKEQAAQLKQKFCAVMIVIAQSIPETPTQEQIQAVTIAIPHLSNVATELTQYIDDDNLIWSYVGLGSFYRGQGLYSQAEQWLEQCLNSCRERLGEDHLDVATSLNNLAELYRSQGRYTEAEPLYLQALELRKRLLGSDHTDVAQSLNNLALLYSLQGRYTEAELRYLQALELHKRLLGSDHPLVALSLNNLAYLYHSQGRYTDAEPPLIQALELRKRLLGSDHPHVATSLNNLAALYTSQGRYESAEPRYLQALELRKRSLGEDHPHVAQSLNNLAELYYSQGRYTEAEPPLIQALSIAESVLGENHPNTKRIRDNFTNCMIMKFLQMPEAEMRQVLSEEACEELLQLKQQMESES